MREELGGTENNKLKYFNIINTLKYIYGGETGTRCLNPPHV